MGVILQVCEHLPGIHLDRAACPGMVVWVAIHPPSYTQITQYYGSCSTLQATTTHAHYLGIPWQVPERKQTVALFPDAFREVP